MKKTLLLLFALVLLKTTYAQEVNNTTAISLGFDLGIPSRSTYSIGVGGSIKGEIPVISPLSLTLTGGYSAYFHKSAIFNSSATAGASTYIPLKAGIRYFAGPGFYLESEAGTVIETNYEKRNLFAFSIGPGFVFPVSENRTVDLGFRYETWSHNALRQTAIRVAYRFK